MTISLVYVGMFWREMVDRIEHILPFNGPSTTTPINLLFIRSWFILLSVQKRRSI